MKLFIGHLTLRLLVSVVFLAAIGFLASRIGYAETWTDATVSFSVEAQFVSVSGTDIVLRKADGKTINVPIARLSDASRVQTKRLYELSKAAPAGGAPATMPAIANTSQYKPKPRQLNFTPPSPPVIPPLKPYPDNASLQKAWEHVRDEALAGRLEVLWQAMPDDIRDFADGHKISDYFNYHLPRIGAHLQLLLKAIPAEERDAFMGQFAVDQTSETSGTITLPKDDGGTEAVEMVRYNNRWLPKAMVASWLEEKDGIIDKMVANTSGGLPVGNSPETDAMIRDVIAQADKALTPLLAASSQQEFDFAIGQVLFPLMMMGGSGDAGPGGPAAAPALPPFPQ